MRMRTILTPALVASLMLLSGIWARGADDPKPDAPKPDAPARPERPARGGPGAGGRGFPGGGPMGMAPRDAVTEAIAALGELNLMPDFTLTKEQKEKVQAIRTTAKTARDKWMADHEADLRKLMEDARAAGGPGGDPDKMREIRTARQELMASAPKTDDAVKELKAALSEDQVKKLDERIAQMEQGRRQGQGRPGGPGGPGGRRPPQAQ